MNYRSITIDRVCSPCVSERVWPNRPQRGTIDRIVCIGRHMSRAQSDQFLETVHVGVLDPDLQLKMLQIAISD